MITSVRGLLEWKGTDQVFVNVGSVSFQVFVPTSTLDKLGPLGGRVQLHTYLHFRTDQVSLYGFSSAEERSIFHTLLGVTGIGPKLALSLLSSVSPDQIVAAVATDNVSYFTRVPGFGKKTASRLVLELKSELEKGKLGMPVGEAVQQDAEVAAALSALGYNSSEINQALASLQPEPSLSTEEKVKLALQRLSTR
ncbi:MAG: Holliday junction branch migration protein RuvA [Chloroflexi bacterium]|nr:Holliday junction branch migration protein RuvA [Chloroflexota bacterium]